MLDSSHHKLITLLFINARGVIRINSRSVFRRERHFDNKFLLPLSAKLPFPNQSGLFFIRSILQITTILQVSPVCDDDIDFL